MASGRTDDFLNNFKKTAEFARELLQENERLRFLVAQHEEDLSSFKNKGEALCAHADCAKKIAELEEEKRQIFERFKEVELDNQNFHDKYLEIENENNNLANLYIASFQLHSTLNFREVIQIIMEIVINLIGAEVFVLFLLDEKDNVLVPAATEGLEVEDVKPVKVGEGVVGETARFGSSYASDTIPVYDEFDQNAPLVCIPLQIKDQMIGVIAIYKLLLQKEQFTNLDHELFTLLAGHAATAIFSSRLYSDSERKRSTMQGLLELLTK